MKNGGQIKCPVKYCKWTPIIIINKTFELVRGKISNKRIIFLQETHPSEDTLNKWWEDSKREVLFLTELQIHAV